MDDSAYDSRRINLTLERNLESPNNCYHALYLSADDEDRNGDEFNPIVCDIMTELSRGHVVLYTSEYSLKKPLKRKWFGEGWRPFQFLKGRIDELVQQLNDNHWNDGLFANIDTFNGTDDKILDCLRARRKLCILQEKLDIALLEQAYFAQEGRGGYSSSFGITIFPESRIKPSGSTQDTIRSYLESEDCFMEISSCYWLPRVYFSLFRFGEQPMTPEDFARKIRPIVEKHGKILEVCP